MKMCGTIRIRPSQLCTNRSYFLFHPNTFRFGCRPPNYLFAHQSAWAVVHSTRTILRIPWQAGTQKRWCGCVKLWYCWVWSKSRWSNMIITMGCRLLNQHRPIMQATELTGDGDSTILNQPNPKLTLKIRWKHPVFQMNQICINNYLWRMYKIDLSNSN